MPYGDKASNLRQLVPRSPPPTWRLHGATVRWRRQIHHWSYVTVIWYAKYALGFRIKCCLKINNYGAKILVYDQQISYKQDPNFCTHFFFSKKETNTSKQSIIVISRTMFTYTYIRYERSDWTGISALITSRHEASSSLACTVGYMALII